MTVGQGAYRYDFDPAWGRMANGDRTRFVSSIACDAEDKLLAFCRAGEAVRVFDPSGELMHAWGEGWFLRPHGIAAAEGTVYCVDDKAHVIHLFTYEGRYLRSLGKFGVPLRRDDGDDHAPESDGPMFHAPTDLGIAPWGEIYVSDGYGNSKVHRLSIDGSWLASWGRKGTGPGEFRTVHGIAFTPDGEVLVSDRGNDRVQVFSAAGDYLRELPDIVHPNAVRCAADGTIYTTGKGYVNVHAANGSRLCRWGKHDVTPEVRQEEVLPRAHGIAVDSHGNLYLGDELQDHGGYLRKYAKV